MKYAQNTHARVEYSLSTLHPASTQCVQYCTVFNKTFLIKVLLNVNEEN
jgi:hypothetical protein